MLEIAGKYMKTLENADICYTKTAANNSFNLAYPPKKNNKISQSNPFFLFICPNFSFVSKTGKTARCALHSICHGQEFHTFYFWR